MLNTQIDLTAFADYALATFDYDENYEEDAFAVTFEGVRVYVERMRACFVLHVGSDKHKLPRC
ncbi:hypothetical protein [Sphingomonas sp. Leaf257]|jgi:hypothetical protein|uniref:hypothetical protein n=1 Tax=Sphingomonas sp. Leaf257 TaxID=1736309 RepID=UPI0006FD442B|nr:hypothetical protein [Sphingomonas sp. Leaf257]KQO55695.1 hypothetical protein ASF14_04925 [Sphingomonas sp. Leaf257]